MPKTRSGKKYKSIMTSSSSPLTSSPDPPKPRALQLSESLLQIGLFLKTELEKENKSIVVDEINIHIPA